MIEYEKASVLVTGGAGFIGSHLVESLLDRGARVFVVDDLSTGRRQNLERVEGNIDFLELDLARDEIGGLLGRKPFDMIFHLAANAEVQASVKDPEADCEKNVTATVRLLEALRAEAPATPLLFTSTAAVYGEGRGKPIGEEEPPAPIAPYSVSKLAADLYVGVYARIFGLRAARLRLFSTYGPRLRKQVVYDLLGKIHKNPEKLFIYGDGSQRRDFNHVQNVVDALLFVGECGELTGEIYNVAGREVVSIRDLARRLCKLMDASPEFVYSGDVRPGEAQQWIADISKLIGMGYEPTLSLDLGLADTVEWFREEESSEL